jgi:hypothetical protein
MAISEDACDRCRVRNPTDSKGNSRGIRLVGDAAGMGGLRQNEFGWTLSMRLTVSGLGCGLAVVCG